MTTPTVVEVATMKAPASIGAGDTVLIRVALSDGATGWGEVGPADDEALSEAVEELSIQVLRRNALAREAVWQAMMGAAEDLEGAPKLALSTAAAMDAALWDAAGRSLGLPCQVLMGGPTSAVVEACVDCGSVMDDAALETARAVAQSDVLTYCFDVPTADEAALERLGQARRLLGTESLLIARVSSALETEQQATDFGLLLDRIEPYWVEGLVRDGCWRELAGVRTAIASATAAGGDTYGAGKYWRALEAGAVDVLTPRLALCGGPTGAVKLAEVTALRGVRLCVSAGDTAVSAMAAGCVALCRRHVGPARMSAQLFLTLRDLAPDLVDGGFIRMADRPGFALSDDWLAEATPIEAFGA